MNQHLQLATLSNALVDIFNFIVLTNILSHSSHYGTCLIPTPLEITRVDLAFLVQISVDI